MTSRAVSEYQNSVLVYSGSQNVPETFAIQVSGYKAVATPAATTALIMISGNRRSNV